MIYISKYTLFRYFFVVINIACERDPFILHLPLWKYFPDLDSIE